MSGSTDAGRLLVRIEATTAQLRQQLAQAEQAVAGAAGKIDRDLKKGDAAFGRLNAASHAAQASVAGLSARLGPLGGALGSVGVAGGVAAAGLAAVGLGLAAVARAGDTATATLARLTSATGGLGQARQIYEQLYTLSQQTGVAVAESAGSFARFAVAAKEIGGTNAQVVQLVSGIQKAGIVAGASTQELGAATTQLAQALASGVLQGDELRSLLENMPQLAQALAGELGVGIGQLRQMGSEGKLTADVVFPALLRATERMNAEFEKMPPTMGRAFSTLGESMSRFAADLDHALGLSQAIARAAQAAAAAVDGVRRTVLPSEREGLVSSRDRAVARAQDLRASLATDRSQFPDGAAGDRLFAAAQANVDPRVRAQLAATEAEIIAHNDRLAEIDKEGQNQRFADYVTAEQKKVQTARDSASRAYNVEREKWDKEHKLRKEHEQRIAVIDKAEETGAISSMEATRDRARATEELNEALTKTATAHRAVAKEAADADAHVKAYLKDQEKAAEAVAKAQEKAAREIERFHERSFDAVAQIGERAFDRLGDSLVDVFLRGEGASVNFGNVLRSVIASALADLAKLAVVNPILNSLFTSSGGARPTLAGAFGGSSTSVGGFGGIGDILGLGQMLGGESIGSMLGLTGAGGLLGGTAIAGWGTSTSAALGAMGGAYGPASLAQLNAVGGGGLMGGAGATFGSLLGGVGAGFGAGMFLNSMLGGNQTSGMIGSGGGALAGAVIGSIVPGIGTLLGGLLGGAAGGGLGGLIGPKPSVEAWGYWLESQGGRLAPIDRQWYNESGAQQFAYADQQVAATNAYLAERGLTVSGSRNVGGNKNGPDGTWGGAASFEEAFADLRFAATEYADLSASLADRSFAGAQSLAEFVEAFTAADEAIKALSAETIPAYTLSIQAVNDNFANAREQAEALGVSIEGMAEAQARAIAEIEEARTETLRASSASLEVRRLRATGDGQAADMLAQAEAAAAEVRAFGAALDALAITAEDKANRLVQLEEVQAAERAAIVARWGEQSARALDQSLNSGQSLLRELAFGSSSALAPEQQYFAALSTLNAAQRDLEAGGDLSAYTAVASQVLPVARDFLGTSTRYAGLAGEVASVIAGRSGDSAGLSQILTAQVGSTDALQATFAAYGEQHLPIASATLAEVRRLASAIEALMTRQSAA